jgi:hypothetical protein
MQWRLARGALSLVAIAAWGTGAAAQVAGPCDVFGPAYNTDKICFDTRPTPLYPTSEAKGGRRWGPDQTQGAIALPTDTSVTPSPALLLLNVSRDGRSVVEKVLFPSNVRMFTDVAVEFANNLRWHPALKHGETVWAWVPWEFQAVVLGASGFISVNVTGVRHPGSPGMRGRASRPSSGAPRSSSMVLIDGVDVGGTPLINYKVRAGRHTIRVLAGDRWVGDTVQVDSGATVVKSYDATPR